MQKVIVVHCTNKLFTGETYRTEAPNEINDLLEDGWIIKDQEVITTSNGTSQFSIVYQLAK